MLTHKVSTEKLYKDKLENEINEFIFNFKKRYTIFPWKSIAKISKTKDLRNIPISVNGSSFTTISLLKEVERIRKELAQKIKPGYSVWKHYFSAYHKLVLKCKSDADIKKAYDECHKELVSEFEQMKRDLMFCLNALKALSTAIKSYHKEAFPLKESENQIDTLVFDFGSVLVTSSFVNDINHTSLPKDKIELLAYKYFHNSDEFTEDMDRSKAIALYKQKLDDDDKKYAKDAFDLFAGSNKQCNYTESLLKSLKKKGYKIYYLSNWNKSSFMSSKNKGAFEFKDLFDGGVVSYEVGVTKPDEKIYRYLINKYHLTPESCLFFDDKKENVDAAIKCGMKAKIFTSDSIEEIKDLPDISKAVSESVFDVPSDLYVDESYSVSDIIDKTEKAFIDNGAKPNISKTSRKRFIETGKTDFGDALCIANLGGTKKPSSLSKLCSEVNKVIKPYGASVRPDNYGTAFLHIKKNHQITESEENDIMFNYESYLNDRNSIDTEQIYSLCTEAQLDFYETEIAGMVVTEGANLDIRKSFIDHRKEYKKHLKTANQLIKNKKLSAAKIELNAGLKVLEKCRSEIEGIDSTVGSFIFGLYTRWVPSFARDFCLCLIPFGGAIVAGILNLIDDWGRPVKKVMDGEKLSLDDFNFYKNRTLARLDELIKKCKSAISKVDSKEAAQALEKGSNVKESVDLDQVLAEAALDEYYSDDDMFLEGANLDIRKRFKQFKAEFKEHAKKTKNYIEDEKFKEAKAELDKMEDILKLAKKDIQKMDTTIGSFIFGIFTSWTVNILRTILLCFVPIIGMTVANVANIYDEWNKPVKKVFTGEDLSLDDFNFYKNKTLSRIDYMTAQIKSMRKTIDRKEKDKAKEVKESAIAANSAKSNDEFKYIQLSIYEACQAGEITLEEREELLRDLNAKYTLENTMFETSLEDVSGKRDMFSKVKKALYEKCNDGIITVEEREELINKAYSKIFLESEEPELANNGKKDKDEQAFQKDLEKAQKTFQKKCK